MKFEGRFKGEELSGRATRIDVAFDAKVGCEAGEINAQILNLSASGFSLRSSIALQPGTEVTLRVAKQPPLKALVRWARGRDAGGVFLESLAL
jgi:hypothetical protein